ncbi:hypothetical protein GGI02_002539 [Coemansia sp. RSA 2322]|nr:hypothetical protein GGI02_002539 [Coemansia sp. RSA 2322]
MSRDGSRPAARAGYGDRYSHASRPSSRGAASYSRSPSRYAREASGADAVYSTASERRRAHYSDSRWPGPDERTRSSPSHQMAIDEARPGVSDSANPLPPPPPPPPPSTQRQGSPSRGYSSRMYRRRSRTPKRDTGNSARTPYAGRHEYDAHGKSLSNGGSYHASAQHSRGHSPGANAGAGAGAGGPAMAAAEPAAPPALVLPAFSHGTDLFISRFPELDEWLKARAQVREQDKRILELSAAARRTGFELSYAGWAVQQAEGQAQLAMWHIERAEQGLDAVSGRSLITASTPGEL